MECNREEALRARDVAADMYARQDFLGAKRFILKAQQLFPSLDGLVHMLAVVEVQSAAQSRVGDGTEMDWYGILQVSRTADDSAIRRQYKALALCLHPDKNKAVGAGEAFNLIKKAWDILSDKEKRTLHDKNRAYYRGCKFRGQCRESYKHYHRAAAPGGDEFPGQECSQAKLERLLSTVEELLRVSNKLRGLIARDLCQQTRHKGQPFWAPSSSGAEPPSSQRNNHPPSKKRKI